MKQNGGPSCELGTAVQRRNFSVPPSNATPIDAREYLDVHARLRAWGIAPEKARKGALTLVKAARAIEARWPAAGPVSLDGEALPDGTLRAGFRCRDDRLDPTERDVLHTIVLNAFQGLAP